jgi:nucleoside-diphosphate-sugar epimerase
MKNTVSILITGATGFVGRALAAALHDRPVKRALRSPRADQKAADVVVGDIGPGTDWLDALQEVDCVVHLAARTHVLDEQETDPLARYREINVQGTSNLAERAAAAGVRRFVFLSSIKVNGEATVDHPFSEGDTPGPIDAYGISKCEAEASLRAIGRKTGMETAILRPPLVYGPGVRGNFLRLLQLIERGMPLPLGSIKNRRSLIGVANLVDAIIACMDSPAAAGQTYLVSDGEDVSTPELVARLARAMGKSPRLLPCPATLLNIGAALTGRRAEILRLTGSLQVDSSRIRRELGWQPRCSREPGLNATVQGYHRGQN